MQARCNRVNFSASCHERYVPLDVATYATFYILCVNYFRLSLRRQAFVRDADDASENTTADERSRRIDAWNCIAPFVAARC